LFCPSLTDIGLSSAGDCSQYETIWMLRLGDDLSISDRDDLWPPHRMALLAQPYQRRSLAFSG
jgi:hypothetical protein